MVNNKQPILFYIFPKLYLQRFYISFYIQKLP